MQNDGVGPGVIGEILHLQRAYNEWFATASPEERAAAAKKHLRYIASIEPDSYGYLFDDEEES